MDTHATLKALSADSLAQNEKLHEFHTASFINASFQARELNEAITTAHNRVPELERFLDRYWDTLNNFNKVVTESSAVIENYIARNTEQLEKQADAITKFTANSIDISNWVLFLVLPLTLQFLMPRYPKTAALLSSSIFIFLALLQRILYSPLQTIQWLWTLKSSGYLAFR